MVIPIHDRNPVRRTPVVTYLLIAVNVVVFLTGPVAAVSGAPEARFCRQQAYFHRWGAIPRELKRNEQVPVTPVFDDGACRLGVATYEKRPLLSTVTAMFVHAGWLHLLGNLLFLYVFGNNVEDRFGRVRFLLCYLGWGVASAYAFALTDPSSFQPLVGASGAIAGVLGAYLVLFPKARVTSLVPFLFFVPLPLPAWMVLGSWFLLQAVYAAGGGVASGTTVAYVAHVAGFLAGILVARAYRRRA